MKLCETGATTQRRAQLRLSDGDRGSIRVRWPYRPEAPARMPLGAGELDRSLREGWAECTRRGTLRDKFSS